MKTKIIKIDIKIVVEFQDVRIEMFNNKDMVIYTILSNDGFGWVEVHGGAAKFILKAFKETKEHNTAVNKILTAIKL